MAGEKVTRIPESLLKKRKTQQALREQKAVKVQDLKKKRVQKRKEIFKRAEKYVKEYRNLERSKVIARRLAKEGGNFYLEPEAKLAVVVRIRGINGVDPRTKKILQLLRLRQIQNGAFVRLNRATLKMLRLVEPYVAYGYPNLKTVQELIYKRGFAKVNGDRIPITDNQIIQDKLGKFNIDCIEDVIHEIYTVGPHFKQVNKFLWPFKLNSPTGGYVRKAHHFQEGGDAGNREGAISGFLQRMI